MEWPAVDATAPMNIVGRTIEEPIQVFGPGDRGSLPRVFPPGRPAPEVFNPAGPTPGIEGMTGCLRQAFAADFNDRARDNNSTGPDAAFDVHDIDLSGIWAPDPEGVPPRLAAVLPPEIGPAVKKHLLESHTTIEQVGRDVAEVAGAKQLVLSHMVPADNPLSRWREAQKGYSGKLVVGEDLMQFGVGAQRN